MSDAQSRFAALPPKQKASVVVFFIIGAFVIYEVIGLFRGGSSSSGSTITPTKLPVQASAASKMAGKAPGSSAQMNKGTQLKSPLPLQNSEEAGPVEHLSPVLSKPEEEKAPPSASSFMLQQDQSQNRYVSAINDLQMLKIQREIAETNQAIVAAKLATVTAEKNISTMLEPEPEPNFLEKKGAELHQISTPPPVMTGTKETYIVQSVTMELDQWHAVLNYKGKLYDVTVGDMLPTDGSTVTAIDAKGVTLELGDMTQRLPAVESSDNPAAVSTPGGPSSSKGPNAPNLAPGG